MVLSGRATWFIAYDKTYIEADPEELPELVWFVQLSSVNDKTVRGWSLRFGLKHHERDKPINWVELQRGGWSAAKDDVFEHDALALKYSQGKGKRGQYDLSDIDLADIVGEQTKICAFF